VLQIPPTPWLSYLTPFVQPNSEVGRLPAVGHVIVPPGRWTGAELADLLAECQSDRPKWGNIFNDTPPLLDRPPDSDARRAAYALNASGRPPPHPCFLLPWTPLWAFLVSHWASSDGSHSAIRWVPFDCLSIIVSKKQVVCVHTRHVSGGPYATAAARLLALWACAERILELVREAYPPDVAATLAINDAAYVVTSGPPQVMHKNLQPRAVNLPDGPLTALSCFLVLTPCPHDGRHGGFVVTHGPLATGNALLVDWIARPKNPRLVDLRGLDTGHPCRGPCS